jgi:hypothetical protein
MKFLSAAGLKDVWIAASLTMCLFVVGQIFVGKVVTTARRATKPQVYRADQGVFAVKTPENVADIEAGKDTSGPTGSEVTLIMEGDLGRFNRAQRAIMNWRETRDLDLGAALLLTVALSYFVLIPVLVQLVGRVVMAKGYREATSKRDKGFVLAAVGGYTCYVLLLVFAIRAIALGD